MSQLNKRALLTGFGALAATRLAAQTPPPPPVRVTLSTALGAITLELATAAPITTTNFLRYVDAGRYDGADFYRALKMGVAPLAGLIQGGLQNAPGKLFSPIAHESTQQTGLSNKDGAIAMARFEPGSATSEFFICIGDESGLDANPALPGDNLGFAVFGHVADGMDVVRAILKAPTSPTVGDGVMKGQMLAPTVAIATARRV